MIVLFNESSAVQISLRNRIRQLDLYDITIRDLASIYDARMESEWVCYLLVQ